MFLNSLCEMKPSVTFSKQNLKEYSHLIMKAIKLDMKTRWPILSKRTLT